MGSPSARGRQKDGRSYHSAPKIGQGQTYTRRTITDEFGAFLEAYHDAIAKMSNGDAEPFVALWSRSDDVTLFGAFGPCRKGWDELAKTFRWVASRWRGDMECEEIQVSVNGDAAYTVGYERSRHLSVDGGDPGPVTIRLTQTYRREPGGWRLVHRHGDFLPVDQSAGVVR